MILRMRRKIIYGQNRGAALCSCQGRCNASGSGTMYRDNSLMPKEAVRLAALGTLAQAGSLRYADLAGAIRHFTSRIVGPSLDLMGTSLELLRYDGLIEALDGT